MRAASSSQVPRRGAALRAAALSRLAPALLVLGAALPACSPLGQEGSSMTRGDVAFAHGDLEEALAEYRLAERQGAHDAAIYARIAHTYARLQRIDEAREYYRKAAALDPALADQAAADFARLARQERRLRDRFSMASSVETAQEFRPGLSLEDLALPMARHYATAGEYGRALPFFLEALSVPGADSIPELVFETAVAYDEMGDCQSAVHFYATYREGLPRWRRGEVDWRLGNCSFQLARSFRAQENDEEALLHLETLLRIGEPRNLLALGYLEKGEILGLRGECDAALEAFREVAAVDPAGPGGSLAARAAERMDQIRFGRRPGGGGLLDFLRPGARGRTGESLLSCFPPGTS